MPICFVRVRFLLSISTGLVFGYCPFDKKPCVMPLPLYTVDAFTAKPFAGNPAAVCLLPAGDWPDSTWMQAVAAEMNLSETAFVRPNPAGTFGLRWMTPT